MLQKHRISCALLTKYCGPAPLSAALSLAATGVTLAAPCTGPGAPTTTQTECLTAVQIPGNPLRSFDISWANPDRAEYYLGDRSNAGIDIINTKNNTFKRTIPGFVGIMLNSNGTVNNNISGPDGVTSHGRWLYAGDGDSTLKVIDLNAPTASAIKQSIPTGGSTRVDEMALTTDGKLLLAANNAEDPPFGTLFRANGDASISNVVIITKITVDPAIIPTGLGLSIEQPTWEPKTARFYVSIPQINVPAGCVPFSTGSNQCDGGMLVIDPTTLVDADRCDRRIRFEHKHWRCAAQPVRTEWRHGWSASESSVGLHPGQPGGQHDDTRHQRGDQELCQYRRHYWLR